MKKDFDWIKRNILSCNSKLQMECCHVMITLFTQKYVDVAGSKQDTEELCKLIEAREILLIEEIKDIVDC